MSKTIHIIGAGIAGLSTAVKLKNENVILYEGTGKAGGRCYSFKEPSFDNTEINNGSHLILECNTAVLQYIKEIGAKDCFEAVKPAKYDFFDLETGERWSISKFPKISLKEAVKLLFANKTHTVTDVFDSNSRVFKMFIEPFTVSALNTKPEKASAYILRNIILRMIFTKNGIVPYIAKKPFSKCLVEPALEHIKDIRYEQKLIGLESKGNKISKLVIASKAKQSRECGKEKLDCHGASAPRNDGIENIALGENDVVILALPPHALKKLLPELDLPTEFSSIMNIHFYLPNHNLKYPQMVGTINGLSEWVFIYKDIISVTISAYQKTEGRGQKTNLADKIWNEIQKTLNISIPLPKYKIINEKRATFLATPENLKRKLKSPYKNLFVIGDFVNPNLPATLEAAVSSGFKSLEK